MITGYFQLWRSRSHATANVIRKQENRVFSIPIFVIHWWYSRFGYHKSVFLCVEVTRKLFVHLLRFVTAWLACLSLLSLTYVLRTQTVLTVKVWNMFLYLWHGRSSCVLSSARLRLASSLYYCANSFMAARTSVGGEYHLRTVATTRVQPFLYQQQI